MSIFPLFVIRVGNILIVVILFPEHNEATWLL